MTAGPTETTADEAKSPVAEYEQQDTRGERKDERTHRHRAIDVYAGRAKSEWRALPMPEPKAERRRHDPK